jgi:hypothetical protein
MRYLISYLFKLRDKVTKEIISFLCSKKIENNEDDSSSEVDHEFDDFVNIDHDQQISDDGISAEVVEKILQVDIETAIKNEDSKDEDKNTTIDLNEPCRCYQKACF